MADMTISQDAVEFELVISHNVLSGAFSVSGHSKNRLVALGMLEYAKQLVNHENIKARMREEIQNAPLIFPGKALPQ